MIDNTNFIYDKIDQIIGKRCLDMNHSYVCIKPIRAYSVSYFTNRVHSSNGCFFSVGPGDSG